MENIKFINPKDLGCTPKTYISVTDKDKIMLVLHFVKNTEILGLIGLDSVFLDTDIPNVKIELKSGSGEDLYGYLMKNIGKIAEDWRVYSSLPDVEPAFARLLPEDAFNVIKSWIDKLQIKTLKFDGEIEMVKIEKNNSRAIGVATKPT